MAKAAAKSPAKSTAKKSGSCALYDTKSGDRCHRKVSQSSAAKAARANFSKAAKGCMRTVGKPNGTAPRMRAIGACVKRQLAA